MKRHVCKKCGKARWARTNGTGMESTFKRDTCKRCLNRTNPVQRKTIEKRVKHKRAGKKPSGKRKE